MAIALITAGGIGSRTGKKVPKQFLTINEIPLIVYTMKNIENSRRYDELYIVCSEGWKDFIISYALQYDISIFKDTICGGTTRFESYYNGLKELIKNHVEDEIISILDGNRPMTPLTVFEKSITEIENADCVLPLEPCFDSMYRAENDKNQRVVSTVDRKTLFKGQSPETSRLGIAYEVCKNAWMNNLEIDATLTALMLKEGKCVKYIEGSPLNFKITTNEDFMLFKAFRTGDQ